MNKDTIMKIALSVIVAFATIIIGSMLLLPVEAAPPAAPTPVANVVDQPDAIYFPFQTATALTADTNTSTRSVGNFDTLDVQLVVDQGTVNTTTLTIQWSVDGSNWVNGPALATNNAADTSDIVRVPVFGRYARINQNLTNSNAITITLVAVGR